MMIESRECVADPGSPESELVSKHCIFQLRGSYFAVSATSVREVTHAPPLVRVPDCPASLAGLCHIRSEFIPIVLLGPLLGERHTGIAPQLLVINGSLGPWALMIDRAVAVDTLETHVDADHRDEMQRTPVLGTATYGSEIVRVLDAQVLHQLVQQSRHRRWHTPANTSSPSNVGPL